MLPRRGTSQQRSDSAGAERRARRALRNAAARLVPGGHRQLGARGGPAAGGLHLAGGGRAAREPGSGRRRADVSDPAAAPVPALRRAARGPRGSAAPAARIARGGGVRRGCARDAGGFAARGLRGAARVCAQLGHDPGLREPRARRDGLSPRAARPDARDHRHDAGAVRGDGPRLAPGRPRRAGRQHRDPRLPGRRGARGEPRRAAAAARRPACARAGRPLAARGDPRRAARGAPLATALPGGVAGRRRRLVLHGPLRRADPALAARVLRRRHRPALVGDDGAPARNHRRLARRAVARRCAAQGSGCS